MAFCPTTPPMTAEAMVRHGHGDLVGSWLDGYMRRLEEFPRGLSPIGLDWQEALGDPRRVADWTVFFRAEIGERPWREVLNAWWPRLLPGVVAAATHGVIRVGDAVRALLADGDDPGHRAELAHGLRSTGLLGGRRCPVGRSARPLPPPAGRAPPRRWTRWPQFPASPGRQAASVTGWPGSARYLRLAWPHWALPASRRHQSKSVPCWPSWSMPRPSGTCSTVTATA